MALSAKQQELKDKLYAIYDNRDFVQGIGPILANDDEVQEMLDYVESGDWVTFSDLTLKALVINRDRPTSN